MAVGLLEASVQEGASIDLVMQRGGLISLASEWTSIENNVLNAGDVDGGVMVEIDIGDDIVWNQAFDSSGMLDLVLPAGTVNLDSEFETIEHDLELTMEYSAGMAVDVIQDTAEDKVMKFNRKVNSDLVVEVTSIKEGTAEFSEDDLKELTAIPVDDEGYVEIELTLNLKYEGTEIADQFTASGGTGVTPDAEFWSIEFLNGSDGEDEIWTDVMDVSMGVGVDNNDTDQVLETNVTVKIILPLQNQSVTLDDGHAVNMRFTSDGGLSEASVRVFIPQQYNISLNDAPEAIGIGDGGETLVTLSVVNNGNGDDTISVQSSLEQSCIDAGWQVTGSTNLTVAANDERAQSFTIFSAQNSTVDKCDIEFTAESEGDFEIQTAETEARISVVRLVIEESLVEPGEQTQKLMQMEPSEYQLET